MREHEDIGLDEALEALRAELESARRKAAGKELQFPVQTLTVELKVAITKRGDGKVGFRVPFVGAEIGASGSHDRASMQTITLVLGSPVDRYGQPVKVAEITAEDKG